MGGAPASWHPDPLRRHELRYWDGTAWTEHVSNRGIVGRDPISAAPATAVADGRPATEAVATDQRAAASVAQRETAESATEAPRRGLVDALVSTSYGSKRLFLDEQALWFGKECVPYQEVTALRWFVFLIRMSSGATRVLSPEGYPGTPVYRLYLLRGGDTTRVEFQGANALETYQAAVEVLEDRVGRRLVDQLLDRVAAGETVEVAGWDLSSSGLKYRRRTVPWGERFTFKPLGYDAGYHAVAVAGTEERKVGKVRHFKDNGPLLPMVFVRGAERFAPKPPDLPTTSAGAVPTPAVTARTPADVPPEPVDVTSLPVDTDWPLELVYSVGNEHSPGSPTGRAELTITGRAARLDHHRFDGLHRRWTARIDADDRHRLRQALAAARFPWHPRLGPAVAGSTMRNLMVLGGSASGSVSLPFQETTTMPGYAEAFTWLDTVVMLMTGGEVHDVAYGADPVVLSDIREVAAEPAEPDAPWRAEAAAAAASAAADLGIQVVSPIVVETGATTVRAMAHFPQFGGRLGMLVFAPSRRPTPPATADLTRNGYGCSFGGIPVPYDRARMVRLLDEWAWVPTDQAPPHWYTGPSLDADDWASQEPATLSSSVPEPRPGPGSVG